MAVKGLPDSCCLRLLITHNYLPTYQPLSVLKSLNSTLVLFLLPLNSYPLLFFPLWSPEPILRIQSWSSSQTPWQVKRGLWWLHWKYMIQKINVIVECSWQMAVWGMSNEFHIFSRASFYFIFGITDPNRNKLKLKLVREIVKKNHIKPFLDWQPSNLT